MSPLDRAVSALTCTVGCLLFFPGAETRRRDDSIFRRRRGGAEGANLVDLGVRAIDGIHSRGGSVGEALGGFWRILLGKV